MISIDIETSGLDPSYCQVIEFGAVYDDLANPKPLDELPRFHRYVTHDRIVGEPYALAMNAKILERIAKREEGYQYSTLDQLMPEFIGWLGLIKYPHMDSDYRYEIRVAGKNFEGFDKKFLPAISHLRFHRRVLDPAALYFDPKTDGELPGLDKCLKRAGIEKAVAHTAIEDALDVLKLVRSAYDIKS